MRSNVYFTSSAVNVSPLWNVALSTRLNVQVVSSSAFQSVASTPTNEPSVSMSMSLLKMLS